METLEFENTFGRLEQLAKGDSAEVELLVERSEKFSTSFQGGKPEKFDSSMSQCAGLRVIREGSEGYAYTENLSESALIEAYRAALENAKFTARGADPSRRVNLLREDTCAAVEEMKELFNDSLESVPVEEKLERARRLEAIAREADQRITAIPYNGYTEVQGETQILTSTGVRRRQRQTAVSGYTYCLAKDGEESRMDGHSVFVRQASEFDPDQVAKEAARRALARLGAAPPETGMYPVVIDAEVASSFLGLVAGYFSAKAVFEKNSIFADDLGKPIASAHLTITDDPFFLNAPGARAFDSEGAASRVTPLVEEGRLVNFLTNSVYAERMKLPHTASAERSARSELEIGISNMVVKPGSKSRETLLAAYPKVIYVKDFSGYHAGFNSGSGDFSLQADGELWENGKRVRPLCNFVVAGNVRQLLEGIEDLSSRVPRATSSVVAPDLLIRQLSVAGK